ncbi:MAG TPA: alpha/beta hydrolase [Reyranella sp.]|nr:alpha/beta hydrolase [Reyranella sp.]
MIRKSALAAVLVVLAAGSARAEDKRPVPTGGDPALACGQVPDGRAYWTEYAYCDKPVLGPAKAKGLIFWSHGVAGNQPSYKAAIATFLPKMVAAGWDVIRINRNNLYERCSTGGGNISNCWDAGGVKHMKDLIERSRQARAQGYQRVVAAGQSFGGAISVEANAAAPDLFYAMMAFSPGHGSDVGSSTGSYYNLDKQILDVIARQKSGRIVMSFPADDEYHPNRWNDPIGPKVRTVLQGSGLPFVLFDNTSPIHGHSAVRLKQFSDYYGDCLRDFLEPAKQPTAGETRCPPPADARVVTAK